MSTDMSRLVFTEEPGAAVMPRSLARILPRSLLPASFPAARPNAWRRRFRPYARRAQSAENVRRHYLKRRASAAGLLLPAVQKPAPLPPLLRQIRQTGLRLPAATDTQAGSRRSGLPHTAVRTPRKRKKQRSASIFFAAGRGGCKNLSYLCNRRRSPVDELYHKG